MTAGSSKSAPPDPSVAPSGHPPTAGRLDGLLGLRVWALHVQFEARLERALARLGLTPAEFRLIGEVMQAPAGIRQGDLARRLGVRAPTVSAAVSRLEADGMVCRRTDPRDPRARLIVMADNAPLLHGVEILEAIEGDLYGVLTTAERRTVADLLDRVTANLTPHTEDDHDHR
jgi:MarR family transcriptional regulator for hemolysin